MAENMLLELKLDRPKCIGSGMCTSIAPDAFELDGDGTLHILIDPSDVPAEQLSAIQDAVVCCPVEALALGARAPGSDPQA